MQYIILLFQVISLVPFLLWLNMLSEYNIDELLAAQVNTILSYHTAMDKENLPSRLALSIWLIIDTFKCCFCIVKRIHVSKSE